MVIDMINQMSTGRAPSDRGQMAQDICKQPAEANEHNGCIMMKDDIAA